MPRITRRTFVAAPAPHVWQLAGNFAEWHPTLRIYANGPEAPADVVVTIVSRDDEAMTLSYHIPDPPFPIANHRATILVEDAGHSCSYVTWEADFTAEPEVLQELEDSIGDDVFAKALDNLATYAQDEYGNLQVNRAS